MMSDWISWLLAAGVLVILEVFSGTFYLLMIAIACGAGAMVALAGLGGPAQTLVAAVVGVLATLLLRRSKYGQTVSIEAGRDANVNMDVGQRLSVPHWVDGQARVMYRGAQWDVQLAPGGNPEAGSYTIQEVRGSRLIVA
jgi:membrane protein implicated in regulation of membrane protease activity